MGLPADFLKEVDNIVAARESKESGETSESTVDTDAESVVETPVTADDASQDAEPANTASAPSGGNSGKGKPAKPSPTSELSAELLEFAESHNLSADDIAGFESVEELQKAQQLVDRQMHKLMQTGRKAPSVSDESIPDPKGQVEPTKQESKPAVPVKEQPAADKVAAAIQFLKDSKFDEEFVGTFEALAEDSSAMKKELSTVVAYIQNLESQQQEARARQEYDLFEQALEEYGVTDQLGSRKDRTDEQSKELGLVLEMLGTVNRTDALKVGAQQIPLTKDHIRRALLAANVKSKNSKTTPAADSRSQRLLQQSRQRMGKSQASTMPENSVKFEGEESGSGAMQDPDFKKFFSERASA